MFARRLVPSEFVKACQGSYGCPDLWELNDGDFAAIGEDITGFANQLPATAGCGPTERMVRIPRLLLIRAKSQIPDHV